MHNMAKAVVKGEQVGDIKQAYDSEYDPRIPHFFKLSHCQRSLNRSLLSVIAEIQIDRFP